MKTIICHRPFFLFLKRFFFLCEPFLSLYWICCSIASLLNVLVFWLRGTGDLSFLTRGWTHTPCTGRWSLDHRTTKEVLTISLLLFLPFPIFDKWTSQVVLVVKNPLANAGDLRDAGSTPGSGRSPEGRNGTTLQDSCLENPMNRGTWRAPVHRVAQSQTNIEAA